MKKQRIAFLVSRFPSMWETFILREFSGIKRSGRDFLILSLKNPKWKITHPEADALLETTRYSPYFLSGRVIGACLHFLFRRPLALTRVLLTLLFGCRRDAAMFFKCLLIVPKTLRYARLLEQEGITHVHAHWATVPAFAAYVMARVCGMTYSVTAHAHDIFTNATMLEEKLSRAVFVVTCAGENRRYLLERFPKIVPSRVHVNYHGIDLADFVPSSNGQRPLPRVLAVGRFEDSKGYPHLLHACRLLKDHGIPFQCELIGDGVRRTQIERLTKELDLHDDVHLPGILPQDEVIRRFACSDVLALPAVQRLHWGIPNVVVEALAMTVPVVVTPLPGLQEILQDGKDALFVSEGDHAGLADALERLIRSPRLRTELGVCGRNVVERFFDQRRNIRELVDIFDRHLPQPQA